MDNKDYSKVWKLLAVFTVIILAGIVIWRLQLLKPEISESPLVITPQTYDFGEISMAKGNVSYTFQLQNTGDDPLTITDVRTSCMCTIAEIDGATFGMHKNPAVSITLPPRTSKSMVVTFDPNAHGPEATGPITRIVYISTNSQATPSIETTVRGNVVK